MSRTGQVWENISVTFVVLSSSAPRSSVDVAVHRVLCLHSDLDDIGRPFFDEGKTEEWHERSHTSWERDNAYKRIA